MLALLLPNPQSHLGAFSYSFNDHHEHLLSTSYMPGTALRARLHDLTEGLCHDGVNEPRIINHTEKVGVMSHKGSAVYPRAYNLSRQSSNPLNQAA